MKVIIALFPSAPPAYRVRGLLVLWFVTLLTLQSHAQGAFGSHTKRFTRQDSLRGTLSSLRSCYDVTFYDLDLKVNFIDKSIVGSNTIHYQAVSDFIILQVDLFDNLDITRITQGNTSLSYKREGKAVFITFPQKQLKGQHYQLKIEYGGHPLVARMPPWDGGFTWKKDKAGKDWLGVSCQHLGASAWWPNKDHPTEEPDSMRIAVAVPTGLTCVANGNLRSTKDLGDGYTRFEWFVSYPINNYSVSLNVADYAHWSDTYTATDGEKLDLDYYVLKENLQKARPHFEQAKPMLRCFEEWFGKYPFWKDGYALVETPYLGMEHQSAVAYGNKYMNGYLGQDLSQTGVGLKWDYIIIHESGHEWFGNSLTAHDYAELWIQEGFTTYSEIVYSECQQGFEAACKYAEGLQKNIANREALIGPLGVNVDSSGDIYPKGANLLHTLRNVVANDDLWKKTLRGFTEHFKCKVLNTSQVIDYFCKETGMNLSPIFRQYLYHAQPPVFEYQLSANGKLQYRLLTDEQGIKFPLKVGYGSESYITLHPSDQWQSLQLTPVAGKVFRVATELFYVIPKQVTLN